MNLFVRKTFKMHSGGIANYKIDCDALTYGDIETLAFIINEYCEENEIKFSEVYGIPTGGIKIANALNEYIDDEGEYLLIVDDVFTTGKYMEEAKEKFKDRKVKGIVIFARNENKCPNWISPVFKMWN